VSLSMPTEFARRVSVSASPLPGLVLALLGPNLNLNLGDRRLGLGLGLRLGARCGHPKK
jgi:hypothetical protein